MRTCTDCGATKSLADFTPIRGTHYTHTRCTTCRAGRARAQRAHGREPQPPARDAEVYRLWRQLRFCLCAARRTSTGAAARVAPGVHESAITPHPKRARLRSQEHGKTSRHGSYVQRSNAKKVKVRRSPRSGRGSAGSVSASIAGTSGVRTLTGRTWPSMVYGGRSVLPPAAV